jgi:hypothetical protein
MGLAWFLQDRDGVRVAEHGGTTRGQNASLLLAPDHGFALALMTNGLRGHALMREATEVALREHLGVEPPPETPYEPSDEELAELAGTYRSMLTEVELRLEAGHLVLESRSLGGFPRPDSPPMPSPPPTMVDFTAPGHLRCLDGPLRDVPAQVLRDGEDEVAWLRFGLRIHRRAS